MDYLYIIRTTKDDIWSNEGDIVWRNGNGTRNNNINKAKIRVIEKNNRVIVENISLAFSLFAFSK